MAARRSSTVITTPRAPARVARGQVGFIGQDTAGLRPTSRTCACCLGAVGAQSAARSSSCDRSSLPVSTIRRGVCSYFLDAYDAAVIGPEFRHRRGRPGPGGTQQIIGAKTSGDLFRAIRGGWLPAGPPSKSRPPDVLGRRVRIQLAVFCGQSFCSDTVYCPRSGHERGSRHHEKCAGLTMDAGVAADGKIKAHRFSVPEAGACQCLEEIWLRSGSPGDRRR